MNLGRSYSGLKCFHLPNPRLKLSVQAIRENKPEAEVCAEIYGPEEMKCWALRALGGLSGPLVLQGLTVSAHVTVTQSLQRPCLSIFDHGAVDTWRSSFNPAFLTSYLALAWGLLTDYWKYISWLREKNWPGQEQEHMSLKGRQKTRLCADNTHF